MRRRQMCIMVWRDMLTQIKNYKWFQANEGNESSPVFWVICMCCFTSSIVNNMFQDARTSVLYSILAIEVFFCILLGAICPMRLPKIMYLCPMEAKERRQYLVTSYVTKVLLAVLVSCIAEIIFFALGYVTWYSSAMAVFAVTVLAISINMAGGERAFLASDAKDKALKKRSSGYTGWLIGQQIYAILYFVVIFICQDMEGGENISWGMLVFYLVSSVINLLLTWKLFTFFKGTLDVLMNYEAVYETAEVRKVGK